MSKSLTDLSARFSRVDPTRTPDWRSRRVDELLASADLRPSKWDDESTLELRRYRMLFRAFSDEEDVFRRRRLLERIRTRFPGAVVVDRLLQRSLETPSTLLFVRARLLAGYSYEEIAKLFGTIPEAIRWYEQCHFHVTDRLDAKDWIVASVLMPLYDRRLFGDSIPGGSALGDQTVIVQAVNDPSLLTLSYFGGRHVCDVTIAGVEQGYRPSSAADVSKWFLKQFSHGLKRRSAQAAMQGAVSKYNVTELFNVTCRLAEMEKHAGKKIDETEQKVAETLLSLTRFSMGVEAKEEAERTGMAPFDSEAAELREDRLLELVRQKGRLGEQQQRVEVA